MIIYCCSGVDKIEDQQVRFMSHFTPWEIASSEKVVPRIRQKIISYSLLVRALKKDKKQLDMVAQNSERPTFTYNQYGKPYLSNYKDLFINSSHCTKQSCLVISKHEVGIDVEVVDRITDKIMNLFLSQEELQKVKHYSNVKEAGCLYWTKKESYSKYLGTGIRGTLKKLLVDLPENIRFHSYWSPKKKFVITVCGELEDQAPTTVIDVDMNCLFKTLTGLDCDENK